MTRRKTNKFSPEVRDRTVRTVLDHAGERLSRLAAVTSIAAKIGCTPQTAGKLKALVRETASCSRPMRSRARQAPILRWRSSTAGPSQDRLHRLSSWGAWGRADSQVLPIAPSTFHAHVAKRRDPGKLSARARQDASLKIEVRRVFVENFSDYGARKVWRQLKREGFDVARCTVSRLMREMGSQGIIRGKSLRTRSATRPRHARWQPSPNPRRGR